jgi:hypothetical protein
MIRLLPRARAAVARDPDRPEDGCSSRNVGLDQAVQEKDCTWTQKRGTYVHAWLNLPVCVHVRHSFFPTEKDLYCTEYTTNPFYKRDPGNKTDYNATPT